jgi:hypothetical protein
MIDAVLLSMFDWSPSSLVDIDEMPERVLWLYMSYREGRAARMNFKGGA